MWWLMWRGHKEECRGKYGEGLTGHHSVTVGVGLLPEISGVMRLLITNTEASSITRARAAKGRAGGVNCARFGVA